MEKEKTTFRKKVIPDPDVVATGQVWRHRLSRVVEPYVTVVRIEMSEPPIIRYTRIRKGPYGFPYLRTYAARLDEFLRLYEFQPNGRPPKETKP